MKQVFKPLGIATAVAAATAGYVNVATAQNTTPTATGDLALVPYYTVAGEWITGIHIVNSSESTQVVKFRFRRAPDSMDALDFNIVMSPKDVYAGFLSDDADGNIRWSAGDTTCTVPATTNGVLTMPDIFREGAESGYVEIIAMGQPTTETMPIAVAAKHSGASADPALTPRSCAMVRGNFFADGNSTRQGVEDYNTTWTTDLLDLDGDKSTSDEIASEYEDSENALKVSYFIRDNASGVEFGDNAVHIQNFLADSDMTNQQFGYLAGDLDGFDFPDLDGPAPTNTGATSRGQFNALRAGGVLGVASVFNEWTANPANGAALDWVVTLPGQYVMLHRPGYIATLGNDLVECVREPASVTTEFFPSEVTDIAVALEDATAERPVEVICDYRDIPVTAEITAWNREEFRGEAPDEDLVVSPSPIGSRPTLRLEKEVNVVTFGGESVLGVSDTNISANLAQPYGWLTLAVEAASRNGICDWDETTDTSVASASARTLSQTLGQMACSAGAATGNVPMIGFAAWERNVAANPDASYGRIVQHSYVPAS